MSRTSSLEGNYSPPSPSDLNYQYTTSPIYPDRPIRPLPKRRLRSRLSPEAVDSILYSPASVSSVSKLVGQDKVEDSDHGRNSAQNLHGRQESESGSYQFRGNEIANGTEEVVGLEPRYPHWRQRNTSLGGSQLRSGHAGPRVKSSIAPSAASSADSVDGYDSFENTNNKKKRKIPISGSLGNHHSSLSADLAHMEISSPRDIDVPQVDTDAAVGQYYGTGSSVTPTSSYPNNNSSAGKSRYGRAPSRRYSGRSPLGPSLNGSNVVQPGRNSFSTKGSGLPNTIDKLDVHATSPSDSGKSSSHQDATNLPTTPTQPHEDVKLQALQSPSVPHSNKTQFTFTCDSDSSKSMTWPGYGFSPTPNSQNDPVSYRGASQAAGRAGRGVATQGTQTSPSMGEHANQSQMSGDSPSPARQPRKPRRSLAKQLAMAARERRLQQDYENYNNPPKDDKIWVCEFCEYESIFGHPPEALIRQYEIKDRRERRRLAEKRRLLEKAKMKGKKGKKGSKSNKNANATQTQGQNQKQRSDSQGMDPNALESPGNQSEDYILDEYDDDEPLPTPTTASQVPSRIPQPVGHDPNHNPRPPGSLRGALGEVAL